MLEKDKTNLSHLRRAGNQFSEYQKQNRATYSDAIVKSFYGQDYVDSVLAKKTFPSYEEVKKMRLFENHPLKDLFWDEKLEQYYDRHPKRVWSLISQKESIMAVKECYVDGDSALKMLLDAFICINYGSRVHCEVSDLFAWDPVRVKLLHQKIASLWVYHFAFKRSERDALRLEIIGATNFMREWYEEEEYIELLEKITVDDYPL